MYGIFMESFVMFKLYGGSGWLLVLYALAFAFLWFREKERSVRVLFLWMPASILFLFFFPLFRKGYVRVTGSGDTQYRMLWLVPMGMTIAYAGCRAAVLIPVRGKGLTAKRLFDRVLAPVLIGLAIALCGSLVYRNPYVSRAENAWHIPQEVIEVSDCMTYGLEEGVRVRAAVPEELVHFIRQYDTDIILAYGRDIIAYGYYNEIHERMKGTECISMEGLATALREAEVDFLVLRKDRETDVPPDTCGWKVYAETEQYRIYADEWEEQES
ncbi:MAG: hypothetical protein K5696_01565 [Lachnospiraceae bacterium]|nr:hypothetical protein [Lachnospiraceae bacterium]